MGEVGGSRQQCLLTRASGLPGEFTRFLPSRAWFHERWPPAIPNSVFNAEKWDNEHRMVRYRKSRTWSKSSLGGRGAERDISRQTPKWQQSASQMETWERSRQVQGTVNANVLGQKRAHLPFPGNVKGSSIIRSVGEKTEALVGNSTCPRSHNPGENPGATLRLRRAFPTLRWLNGRRRQGTERGGVGPRSHSRPAVPDSSDRSSQREMQAGGASQ